MPKSDTQFKKGQSGNPGGAKKLPEDLKHLINTTGIQVKRDLFEVWNMDLQQLFVAESQPGISAGRAAIISCLNNCIQNGDNRILATFLDRLIGKPKEMVEISQSEDKKEINQKDQVIDRLVKMISDKRK